MDGKYADATSAILEALKSPSDAEEDSTDQEDSADQEDSEESE